MWFPHFATLATATHGGKTVTDLDGVVWWWRTLDWWGVRRARLWQGVVCVGVVAVWGVILGLLMWAGLR